MDFFTEDIKLASYSWKPEKVDKKFRDYVKTNVKNKKIDGGICAHSHVPYTSYDKLTYNSGSWMTNEMNYDTFLLLDDGEISLKRYNKGKIENLHMIYNFSNR